MGQVPLKLKWISGPDMPIGMTNYIQSEAVQGTIYIGGGSADLIIDNNYIVMAYDTRLRKWHELPSYGAKNFAMTVINDQLVLVGGHDCDGATTNLLGVWKADCRHWSHPYPFMPTKRSFASAVGYKQWLVVAGGMSSSQSMATFEVLDVVRKQWHSGPPAPVPCTRMKSTVVGDVWYLMGGCVDDQVITMSFPDLISLICSKQSPLQTWKIISGLGCAFSSPLCVGGSLLAVGGINMKANAEPVSSIRRYLPETNEWVEVGALPSPIFNCTCALTTDGVLVAGGNIFASRVYLGSFQ